ncbi:4585_t:CDS:2 [Funneliformis caledonium]|uniref:4585_t:CDS:1 n=1 Tax=Funneliformis caledonium TaxID=1117310 RepID=A0A9N9FBT9_9GLOM|nr:4585_t:CDS:2 [Funneliformis caledonium]
MTDFRNEVIVSSRNKKKISQQQNNTPCSYKSSGRFLEIDSTASKIFEEIGFPAECLATANIIQIRAFDSNDSIIDTRLRDFGKKSLETDESLRNLYSKGSSVLTEIDASQKSKYWFQNVESSKTKIEEFRRNVQYFGERLNHFIKNIEELMEDLRLISKKPVDVGKDLENLHKSAHQMKIILRSHDKLFADGIIEDDKFVKLIKDYYYEFNKEAQLYIEFTCSVLSDIYISDSV